MPEHTSREELGLMGLNRVLDSKGTEYFADVYHFKYKTGSTDPNVWKDYMAKVRQEQGREAVADFLLYRTHTSGKIFHLDFYRYRDAPRGGKVYRTYGRQLTREKNKTQSVRRQGMKSGNIKVLRLIQMGCPDTKIHCPIDNVPLEDRTWKLEKVPQSFEQHHYLFWRSKSLNKKGQDPAKNNEQYDYTKPSPACTAALMDSMATICISPLAHSVIHDYARKQTENNSGDITDYHPNQLSFIMQSQKNYNFVVGIFQSWGHQGIPSYREFLNMQTLAFHNKPK